MSYFDQQLPAFDTLPGLVLVITALSGEIPTDLITHFSGGNQYKAKAVKRLKRDKLIRSFYRDGLRGLRLTTTAKKLLLEAYPDWLLPYLSGKAETNRLKSEIPRRLRLHRMAEVLVIMLNSGAAIFPWEKPAFTKAKLIENHSQIFSPTYFTSRELKEFGPQANKFRGARATGVLIRDRDMFLIYNTGAGEMNWNYKAEMRLKAFLQVEFPSRTQPSAIVFGSSMSHMEPLMGIGSKFLHNYLILDENFRHFFYLTNDHHGEILLQILYDKGLRTTLDTILLENLSAGMPDATIVNDGYDEYGDPVLFGYLCDMPRIKRFDTALSLHEQHGTLICFDFQEQSLRRICSPRVTLQCIDFDAFERSVLYPTEENC